MRILHFLPVYVPAWQFGGPILSVSRLCESLAREGVDVRVITTNAGLPDFPNDQLAIPQNINGVQVTYYPVDNQEGLIRSRALVEALREHMAWAELLHLSSIWQPLGLSVQRAAHAAGIPVVQTLRGALGPYSWRSGWWKKIPYFLFKERPLLQRAASLHCTTLQECREISWLSLKPPVQLLANPLELSHYRSDATVRQEWRLRLGIPPGETLFIVVGRLHHKKGLDILPFVLKKLIHKKWHILFIGRDEDGTKAKLRKEFKSLGLNNRVHWMNVIPSKDLIGPYNAADCLLLPSRHENFGNVVIEALACGCGTLMSPNVGVSSELKNCPGSWIVNANVSGWNTTMSNIVNQPRPGQASVNWVKDRYSGRTIARKAISYYFSILH